MTTYRLGLTVTESSQRVWLDDSIEGPSWSLDSP